MLHNHAFHRPFRSDVFCPINAVELLPPIGRLGGAFRRLSLALAIFLVELAQANRDPDLGGSLR
jgi:hypothetical protein